MTKKMMKAIYILLVALTTFFLCDYTYCKELSDKTILGVSSSKNRKVIKILSIDGGGIRGIIPAFILKNLEGRLKIKKLSECFDVMAGTSTGGIIVLLLNTPDRKISQNTVLWMFLIFIKTWEVRFFTNLHGNTSKHLMDGFQKNIQVKT